MNQETYTQTAPNSTQIRTQNNNFYSYNYFKPLKNFKETIRANKSFVIEKNILILCIFIYFGLSIILSSFIFDFLHLYDQDFKNTRALSIFLSFYGLSFLIYLVWIISLFFKLEITINENGLIIDKKENIEYKNIRSFLMEKNLFSYSFFIYEIDKIEPIFKFKVYSIHEALAIEELLKSKLITKEKNENRSKE